MAADLMIPIEVWFNHIFTKLPAKSVLLCKCVCRAWNGVLSDPEFVRTHLLHQHQRLIVQGRSYNHAPKYYSVECEENDNAGTLTVNAVKVNHNFLVEGCVDILGSSNGLLCSGKKIFGKYRTKVDLAIWNPSTGDFKSIPECPTANPNYFEFQFGFYYDSFLNDGNIVCFTGFLPNYAYPLKNPSLADIYSIKSNSWKTVEISYDNFSIDDVQPIRQACGMNGCIYWLVTNYLGRASFIDILVFNIKHNKFRKVQLPRGCDEGHYVKDLTVLGSTIGVYGFSRDKGFVVWSLKQGETEEWIKLINMNVSFLKSNTNLLEPLCLTKNQKVLVLHHYRPPRSCMDETKLLSYDPIRNKTEYLSVHGISLWSSFQMVAYVESLVSPNDISRDDGSTGIQTNKSDMIHEMQVR